jgi:tetratricopeptide (TPR) repeat protein
MMPFLLKRVEWVLSILALFAFFLLISLVSQLEIKDLDLWLHLASGKYILEHKVIPAVDIFSATVSGHPWINHEWLFQVFIYPVYERWGAEGPITLQSCVLNCIFVVLLFLTFTREQKTPALILLFITFLIFKVRIFLRPDTFSLFFFSVFLFCLFKGWSNRLTIWILFILQVIWTNVHGFFILGPVLTGLFLLAEMMKRKGRLPFEWNKTDVCSDQQYRSLKILFPVLIFTCFINPYFVNGVIYPFKVLFSLSGNNAVFFREISELEKPITFANIFNMGHYGYYKLMIVLSLLSFVVNYRRLNLALLFIWLMMLLSSLTAFRNMLFFALTACVVILWNIRYLSLRIPELWGRLISISMLIALLFVIQNQILDLKTRGYYDFDRFERKSEFGGISLRNFPYKAVDFLSQNHIQGNFFNDFNSGAYLIGRMFPDIHVFIDGRTELYGPEFYSKYSKIWRGDTKLFEEAVKQYHLTGVLLNSVYVPASEQLISYLYNHPDWKLVYFDFDAAIFLKNTEQNLPVIQRYALDLHYWKTEEADLMRFGLQDFEPYRYTNRAEALLNLKFLEQAQREAVEALRISAKSKKAYKILGKIYYLKKEYPLAFEYLRKAKLLNAKDMEIRYFLAATAFELGNNKLAYEQATRVLGAKKDQSKALLLLARIYFKMEQYTDVAVTLENLKHIDLPEADELFQLGDMFFENKQYNLAKKAYQIVLVSNVPVSLKQQAEEKMKAVPHG